MLQLTHIAYVGVVLLAVTANVNPSPARTIEVHCPASGQGHSLANAIATADPGDVIQIEGTCTDRIKITTDRITLDGLGRAVFQGPGLRFQVFDPLIGIDGAQGVVIRGLRVENGNAEAIAAQNGAAVALQNVTLRGSTIGLLVAANSTAQVADSSIENNFVGVDMFTGSTLVLKGRVSANGNQRNGFDVTGNSTVELRGAEVEARNNGGHGITLDQSQLILLGFPPAQGSSVVASGNQGNGLFVSESAATFFGDPGANSVTVANNGLNGIRVMLGGRLSSPQAAVRFSITGNPTGILFESNATALISGGLEVHGNGVGIMADGAGVLTLGSTPQVSSSITGNTTRDFDARFGTRVRLAAVPVGTVACDATVLSQGLCP